MLLYRWSAAFGARLLERPRIPHDTCGRVQDHNGRAALLPRLAAAGIPHGDDGAEVADGVMTDLSWQGRRVAVVADPMEGDVEALAAAGWRVVVPEGDPERTIAEIVALLEGH